MFTPFNDTDLDGLAKKQVAVVHPVAQEIPVYARGYAANNVYPGFPPLMNDGRALIASWQPEAVENEILLKKSGVKSNWEYRKYLTHNAKSIIETNFAEAANDSGYYTLDESSISTMHTAPAQYDSYIEPEHVYGKFDSDLKSKYLSREQLAARMVTPVISQSELLEWQKTK
jgi:hypothetical protein